MCAFLTIQQYPNMNILHEIRNAFGFPQLVNIEVEKENKKETEAKPNYRIVEGDDEEDYFPQLGAI